ncbi:MULTISPECIES: sodium:solute symporter [Aneurinibacillus]|uniref:Sodium:solute symporter n=1 Tax=Aneurinibacillus thermoaerophilus TaxID=143495 RepID=A0A1G8ECG6_ANETH|nr:MULTISPECIES: sodium:solute symporter [Aneurinibacillus]AMA72402.1 sodium:solute symporter [Aneurinibacillus sp. XH2]MED0676349.1 sodium:solute symporter [Aneurinibacillus thermoaerophilus]MED0679874.1 sodium:solute symporter [Aneurinibacillus thermoaerophilus]MED0737886.1 sodium:solute symporter [Aneurinibacillus thermoaerophilus]MED0759159.1 sodium:solute symporter [Aneurinibacillus thermoaerophilus]
MNGIDVSVIVLYLLIIALVGVLGARRAKTSEDYIVAGRNLNFSMYFGCIAALTLGGAATIGTAKLGYQSGISGIWFVTSQGIGLILLSIFLAKKIFNLRVLTISEMLEKRFSVEARLISSLVAATYTTMLTVTQIIGIGSVLKVWLGWNFTLSIVVAGGIVLLYTVLGGMWSVTMTDIVQFIVMSIGIFVIMLPMSLSKVGGLAGLQEKLPSTYFDLSVMGGTDVFKSLLLYALGIVVGQDVWQRVFTARSLKTSRYGMIAAGGYSFLYAITVALIGMCAFVALPGLQDPQNAFASMAIHTLPAGVLGVVLAGVLSALMSTASGTLIASSTLLVNDIIGRFFLRQMNEKKFLVVSRITTLSVGIFAMICALWIQDILVALDIAFAVLSGALFFPIILGFFWKRVSARAVFYSIMASSVVILVSLALEGTTSIVPILYGLATSGITIVLFSYLFPDSVKVNMNREEEGVSQTQIM